MAGEYELLISELRAAQGKIDRATMLKSIRTSQADTGRLQVRGSRRYRTTERGAVQPKGTYPAGSTDTLGTLSSTNAVRKIFPSFRAIRLNSDV
jgi:hypothetical protein